MSEDPLNAIEALNSMRDLATAARAFHQQLREEGFSESEAIRLTAAWITGITQGAVNQ